MSTFTVTREAIATTLETVANIGVVHRFERYAKNSKDMRAFYQWQSEIRGWFIRRETSGETSRNLGSGVEIIRWQVRGLMSLNDAAQSELTFDDLIESVRDAVRADETLGGAVDGTVLPANGEAGIQVIDSGPAMFANTLVHACRLRLNTVRYY